MMIKIQKIDNDKVIIIKIEKKWDAQIPHKDNFLYHR